MPKRFPWLLIVAMTFAGGLAIPRAADAQSADELRRWIRWCEEDQNGTWNNDPSNPVCYPGTRNRSTSQGVGAKPAMLLGFLVGGGVGTWAGNQAARDLPQEEKATKRLEGFAIGAAAGFLVTGMTLQLIAKHTLPLPLPVFLGGRSAATLSIHPTGVRADVRW